MTSTNDQIFGVLFHRKTSYAMRNGFVSPLESWHFNQISEDDAKGAMQALQLRVDERYYDLKHFGVNVVFGTDSRINQKSYDMFMSDHLIPFIKISKNQSNLKSLHLEYGNGLRVYGFIDQYVPRSIKLSASYLEPMVLLLSNLPKSLQSLTVCSPSYRGYNQKIKDMECKKLVNKFCQILSEQDEESKLETIVWDNFKLTLEAKDFLVFMFGFNNNISFHKRKCILSFM